MPAQIRRWKRWLRTINREVVGLAHQRRIFREIAILFRTNPMLQKSDATIWQWLAENYVITAAVAIRRQADRGGRRPVVSLERLLTDMAAHPEVLTRNWFVRQYTRGKPGIARNSFRKLGERAFNNFAGRTSERVSSRVIRSDRKRLREAAARIRHYVNKRVAHRALRGYRGPATFGDLDEAIDELGNLLRRYQLLVNQAGMGSVEPVIQGDWEAVFRVRWKV